MRVSEAADQRIKSFRIAGVQPEKTWLQGAKSPLWCLLLYLPQDEQRGWERRGGDATLTSPQLGAMVYSTSPPSHPLQQETTR